ncbi:unnamed protein product [Spirodela intermedia]|uniref:Uncharacterized protein n=1 Tax=Spirodela intermedia TaxID=51605 RepID=A0A7I8J6Z5_SPIIN|nr:unnamed protein product [Spirodela intermedia]CAA6665495.1 unnamed protein product [Spirodela intermedia]
MWIVIAPPMGEDRRQLAGDCVAVCSCCPCLVVQILVLLVVGVPRRLARNSRELVRRKLGGGGRRSAAGEGPPPVEIWRTSQCGSQTATFWEGRRHRRLPRLRDRGGGGGDGGASPAGRVRLWKLLEEEDRRGRRGAPPWKSGCAAGRVVEVRLA